mmetsp:Transcript_62059/g.142866  ORF Transcript_62059/g.142866 Transcript_62059/m.142866 type:complete len:181 (+) Transcript_62059:755-1297(+)
MRRWCPVGFFDLWPLLRGEEPGFTEDSEINLMLTTSSKLKSARKVRFDRILLRVPPVLEPGRRSVGPSDGGVILTPRGPEAPPSARTPLNSARDGAAAPAAPSLTVVGHLCWALKALVTPRYRLELPVVPEDADPAWEAVGIELLGTAPVPGCEELWPSDHFGLEARLQLRDQAPAPTPQ